MPRNRQSGFTLVELLVVITIIGILMSMAFPAVTGVMERMRTATCLSSMKDLGTALNKYKTNHGGQYPGLIENRVPSPTTRTDSTDTITVFAILLSNIGSPDLYKKIRGGDLDAIPDSNRVGGFICPSDLDSGDGGYPTSYVANAGRDKGFDYKSKRFFGGDGVFYNRSNKNYHRRLKTIQSPTQTIVFSENVQAGLWYNKGGVGTEKNAVLGNVGMVWNLDKLIDPDNKDNYPYGMNQPEEYISNPFPESGNIKYARPSSMHGGGANFVFADGHGQFISTEMEYITYVRLMCSNWERSSIMSRNHPVTGKANADLKKLSKNSGLKNYTLSEGDY